MHTYSKKLIEHHALETHNISPFSMYLKEIVYGGTDGIVTTFAVVAGFAGAQASMGVLPVITVLLFGFANLFADGVSMALGSYLATRSEHDVYKHEEHKEIAEVHGNEPSEIEETHHLFMARGFSEKQAKDLTAIVSTNKEFWVDFMMQEEIGMSNPSGQKPLLISFATFASFLLFGVIPLVPYVLFQSSQSVLTYSIITTAGALLFLGFFRYKVTRQSMVRSVTESLLLGGLAAAVAFVVGSLFKI